MRVALQEKTAKAFQMSWRSPTSRIGVCCEIMCVCVHVPLGISMHGCACVCTSIQWVCMCVYIIPCVQWTLRSIPRRHSIPLPSTVHVERVYGCYMHVGMGVCRYVHQCVWHVHACTHAKTLKIQSNIPRRKSIPLPNGMVCGWCVCVHY